MSIANQWRSEPGPGFGTKLFNVVWSYDSGKVYILTGWSVQYSGMTSQTKIQFHLNLLSNGCIRDITLYVSFESFKSQESLSEMSALFEPLLGQGTYEKMMMH
jgi:hypothetical protein